MTAPVRQVVHQHDAMHGIVEHATRVLVTDRTADVPQLDEVGALRGRALFVLVQFHLDGTADRPAGRCERLVVGDEVRQRGFADTCGSDWKRILI